MDRRRMPAQRRDPDLHEWKQRQAGQDVVQFLRARDVEYADIGVAPGHPPQMAPGPCALQLHGADTLRLLQRVGSLSRQIVRDPYLHFDVKQHDDEIFLQG